MALDQPNTPVATRVNGDPNAIAVLFDDVANAETYTVKVYRAGTLVQTEINFSSGDRVTGLDASTAYTVTVTADAVDPDYLASPESAAASVTTSGGTLAITAPDASLLGARYNRSFTVSVEATGGDGDFTFSLDSGELPTGLTLNTSTGAIAGTPTETGTFPLIVSVTDGEGQSAATAAFTVTVVADGDHSITWKSDGGTYIVVDGAASGTVLGEVRAIDTASDSVITYAIAAGSASGFAVDSSTGVLTTTQTVELADGESRTLLISASNGVNPTETATFTVQVVSTTAAARQGVRVEKWENVGDSTSQQSVLTLTSSDEYAGSPTTDGTVPQVYLTDSNGTASDRGDHYGMRFTGYLIAPETGEYRFYLASDNGSEFRIGTSADASSLPTAAQVALDSNAANLHWYRRTSQTSEPIYLVKGQAYTVQTLFHQKDGADRIALAWMTPSGSAPVSGSADNIVPASAFYLPSLMPDTSPPSRPANFGVASVTTSAVNLTWNASTDNVAVDHYVLTRDGVTIDSAIAPRAGIQRYADAVTTGTHTYVLTAVDAAGNVSPAATLTDVVAGVAMDAIERAMISGDASQLSDIDAVMARLLEETSGAGAVHSTLLDATYASAFTYEPSGSESLWAPSAASQGLFPIIIANDGSDTSMAVAGSTPLGTKFAMFGTRPFNGDTGMEAGVAKLATWMLTGSTTDTPSGKSITVLAPNSSAISSWASAAGLTAGSGSITTCSAADSDCFAAMGASDLIIVDLKTGEADPTGTLAALTSADRTGTAILAFDEKYGYYDSTLLTDAAGYFQITRSLWYWNRKAGDTTTSDLTARKAEALAMGQADLAALGRTVAHLRAGDWNIDLTPCTRVSCPAGSAAATYMQSEFYAGARDYLRTALGLLSDTGTEIFGTPADAYRALKLSVLLGDMLRRTVEFPVVKTELNPFFNAFFSDHAVYTLREAGEAQADLGTFSDAHPERAPRTSKTVSFTARESTYMAAATVYGVPGEPITVQRTDSNSDLKVQVSFTTLRDDQTHPFDIHPASYPTNGYRRPAYMRSHWVTVRPGETITLNSPRGGPMSVNIAGADEPFPTATLTFGNVVQHPVWDGDASTAQFETILEEGNFDWAELLTPGFQIHTTVENLRESLEDPEFNTPAKLAAAAYKDFYQSNYNLAGFVGPGLAASSTVAALCTTLDLNCTNTRYHRIPSMNHFNSDEPTCGDGCSGNPYDAGWAFAPLGWGDAHEMGHNIQSLHVTNQSGATITGEVSNNIFPTHTVAAWNAINPHQYRTHSHELDQEAFFALFATAARQPDAAAQKTYVYDRLWKTEPVDFDVTFTRDGVTYTRTMNQNTAQVMFYVSLVNLAREANALGGRTFGDGGWDVITLLHKIDREMNGNRSSSEWATWSAAHGFDLITDYDAIKTPTSTYPLARNDRLLLMTSWAMGLDMRPYFDMWGIYYSDLASSQVAAFDFAGAPQRLHYFPVDGRTDRKRVRDGMWGLQPIGHMDFGTDMDQVPATSMLSLVPPDGQDTVPVKRPVTLRAWTSGLGTVTFTEAGETIFGCEDVATVVRDKSAYTSSESLVATDFEATCTWTPQTEGNASVGLSYTPSASETTIPSERGSTLTAPAPATWTVRVGTRSDAPTITGISTAQGDEGSVVTLTGTGLDRVNGATFNGYRASVLPGTSTSIRLRVPVIVNPSLVSGSFVLETWDGFRVSSPSYLVVKHVTSVSVSPPIASLARGQVLSLAATVAPSYATDRTVAWTTSDSSVASVDADTGAVVARAVGSATITATSTDGGLTGTSTVTVLPSPPVRSRGVTITTTDLYVRKGQTADFAASLSPAGADASIGWASSDSSVATVNATTGQVTGVGYGTAVLTATPSDGGAADSVTISVVAPVFADDTSNTITGDTTGLEWTINEGEDWTAFTAGQPSQITQNQRVVVREVGVSASTVPLVFSNADAATNPLTTVLPDVTYVSDLPFTGTAGSIHLDDSGKFPRLSLDLVHYARGVYASPGAPSTNSTFTVALNGRYGRFVADVGLNDSAAPNSDGQATFIVKVDGVEAYRSPSMTGASATERVDVDVAGASTLQLIVDPEGDDSKDHAVWAGAQLTPPVAMTLPSTSLSLAPAETATLTATVTAAAATSSSVKTPSYTSSDTSVATVDSSGIVTAVGVGAARITASVDSGSLVRSAVVRVAEPGLTSLVLPVSVAVDTGSTQTISPTTTSDAGTTPSLVWSSSDTSVVTVDSSGVLTGVTAGTATITATSSDGGFQATTTAVVSQANVETPTITSNPQSVSKLVGQSLTLSVTATVADGGTLSYQWSKGGSPLAGETSATLSIGTVALSDAGAYSVAVTNTRSGLTATATSASATLTVTQPVTGVTLDRASATLSEGGNTTTLVATVAPADASNKGVTWASSDSTVATVSGGIVTPIAPGTATVTVTTQDGSLTAQASITVTAAAAGSPSISSQPSDASKTVGQSLRLTVSASAPEGQSGGTLTYQWQCNGQDVVEDSGTTGVTSASLSIASLTVADAGDYTVIVTHTRLGSRASVTSAAAVVEVVQPVTGVTVSPTTLSLQVGDPAATVTASVLPSDATTRSVTWATSNRAVATVSSSGVVVAIGAGSATITVTTLDQAKSAQVAVTVTAAPGATVPTTGVALRPTSLTLTSGGSTGAFTPVISPSNATNQVVTWATSNASVATVVNGVVTPLATGTAVVTVTTQDGNHTASATVRVTAPAIISPPSGSSPAPRAPDPVISPPGAPISSPVGTAPAGPTRPNPFNPTPLPFLPVPEWQPNDVKDLSPGAAAQLTVEDVASLNPNVVAALPPVALAAIPPAALGGFKRKQFAAIPPTALAQLEPEQLSAIPPRAIKAVTPQQIVLLPTELVATLSPRQVAAIRPKAVAKLSPEQIGALPTSALSALKPSQVRAMGSNAVAELTERIEELKPASLKALPTAVLEAVPAEQVPLMTPRQLRSLRKRHLDALGLVPEAPGYQNLVSQLNKEQVRAVAKAQTRSR